MSRGPGQVRTAVERQAGPGRLRRPGALVGRGDDPVGSPHRAQISRFELFELEFINSCFCRAYHNRFAGFDLDGDGVVEQDEFLKALEAKVKCVVSDEDPRQRATFRNTGDIEHRLKS